MGGSIRRSRAILRAAFATLRRNPRLAWFPVLLGLGMAGLMVLGAAVVGIGTVVAHDPVASLGLPWSAVADPNPDVESMLWRSLSVGGLLLYVGGHLLSIGIGVAMAHAALEALAGRPWTVRQSLGVATRRRGAIVTFAIIEAIVGHLLSRRRTDRKGRRKSPGLLRQLAGFAWWAATYLVLPVIARENRGGIGSIERSAKLWAETWKETLIARLAVGWLWVPAIILAAAPCLVCVALGVREPATLAILVAVSSAGLMVFGLMLDTLKGIYRAALYSYASEGVVPDAFAHADLDDLWVVPRDVTAEVIDVDGVDADELDTDEPAGC